MATVDLTRLIRRLASRDSIRSEAEVQSDVRTLLLYGGLNLEDHDLVLLEAPVGQRQRIDVEAGTTVIEVKKDLRVGRARADAIEQLAGYVRIRSVERSQSYAGILTDGAEWELYHLHDNELRKVSQHTVVPQRLDEISLCSWLEAVLSTASSVIPGPFEIERKLGESSPSYAFDIAELADLWNLASQDSESVVKRKLWADLVSTAHGTAFDDTDELFVQHTYLVIVAELIAHELVGVDPTDSQISVANILAGIEFHESQVSNVVESDFFDWPAFLPGGESFIRRLARRIHRFDWDSVQHDVLKILYESVIDEDQRKLLGETYTPDWLAEAIVERAISDPKAERVHDPACGSGTFLFHAVRAHLAALEDAGVTPGFAALSATHHISGVDIQPVAVTLARVTYLLAIGQERLTHPDRGPISIPVYLGDSCQWGQSRDLFSSAQVRVATAPGLSRLTDELVFPRNLVSDSTRFDTLVSDLVDLATGRSRDSARPDPEHVLDLHEIDRQDRSILRATFLVLCDLFEKGEDGIWGYYVRNLVRPVWLSQPENRVDVLIGNPPWLGYKFMTKKMQGVFKEQSATRALWSGGKFATQMDLATYFVVRSCELYLRDGGKFMMVVPRSVLSREQYRGFRDAKYPLEDFATLNFEFDVPWDLFKVRPHFFPYPAAVVAGHSRLSRVSADGPRRRPMPMQVEAWRASLQDPKGAKWADVSPYLECVELPRAVVGDYSKHPYHPSFSQGAIFVPRVLMTVREEPTSRLGSGAGRVRVSSARSSSEKKPWKSIESLSGTVERGLVYPLLVGENLLPYRLTKPGHVLAPVDPETHEILDLSSPRIHRYPGFRSWWTRSERLWSANCRDDSVTLSGQVDYMHKLQNQFPLSSGRVIYNTSGMYLSAAYWTGTDELVDSSLYWASVPNRQEGMFLVTILNSDVLQDTVSPLMASGKDERHFHKSVFALSWPKFNPADHRHNRLAELGEEAVELVAAMPLDGVYFVTARSRVRRVVDRSGITDQVNALVTEIASESVLAQ